MNMSVPARGWIFDFETSKGLATHIVVTVPLPRREDWPIIRKDPAPGIRTRVEPKIAHLPFIQRELRALQGLLSLFGLHSIDLEDPEIEWLPESEKERTDLHLFSYTHRADPLPDDKVLPLPFDVLARAVIASDAANDIEVPLNFFRRGMLDLYNRNYIEAIYDFYFILETIFSQGKFKKAAVLDAFKNSEQLRSYVQRALDDPSLMIAQEQHTQDEFQRTYRPMNVDQALEKIVELRGHLHHHTQKRLGAWRPDDQRRFECDAFFLQTIANNIVFATAESYLWDEGVIRAYKEIEEHHRRQQRDTC